MMRNATWTVSNLCRGKPSPPFDWVSPALPALANLIYATDVEVLTDACWARSYLSDGPNDRIQAVIQAGVCRRLVELLQHTSQLFPLSINLHWLEGCEEGFASVCCAFCSIGALLILQLRYVQGKRRNWRLSLFIDRFTWWSFYPTSTRSPQSSAGI
jgi:hypothetical protein